MKNKFKFRKANIKDESHGGDDDAEDVDEMDGGADLADVIHEVDSDGDIDEDFDMGGGNIQAELAKQMEAEMQQNAIITSNVSKEKWQIEVEKVAHKLKINTNITDGKEWRSHLEQTKKYAENVRNALPEVRGKLERLQDEASKSLEKIGRKEGVLTRSFQGMTGDYRAHSDTLRDIQTQFTTVSKNVENLEQELTEINEKLEGYERKIDDTGKSFSDNSPLQNIKKQITQIKNDIKAIDIRIGVVSNTLL